MRVAVVGHVEWIDFARVERLPAPGEIVHTLDAWEEPGGGGAVCALELARLGADVSFFTVLGDDGRGRRARAGLAAAGVRVEAPPSREPTARAVVHVDSAAERTITVLHAAKLVPAGADPRWPWPELAAVDAVHFVAGDAAALRAARAAPLLTATPRELPTLREAAVELDAVVGSARDPGERYTAGDLDPPPRLVVRTGGAAGGAVHGGGRFAAAPLPGPPQDAYGAGDSFAAALTFALARRRPLPEALAFAAARGAAAVARRGVAG